LTHGSSLFEGANCSVEERQMYRMLAKATKVDDRDEVQATAVEVICKLMLAQVIKEEEVCRTNPQSMRLTLTCGCSFSRFW
jgi:condensin complex subunit 3